jgi:hypothetical protein
MQDELTRDAFGVMLREGAPEPARARPRIASKARKHFWISLATMVMALRG